MNQDLNRVYGKPIDYYAFARRNRIISSLILLLVFGIEFFYFAWTFNRLWPNSGVWVKLGTGFLLWMAFAIFGYFLHSNQEDTTLPGLLGTCLLNTVFLPVFLVEKVVTGEQVNYDRPSAETIDLFTREGRLTETDQLLHKLRHPRRR